MTNHEVAAQNPAELLVDAIDAKFEQGVPRRGGIVREHEEKIALIPTEELSHCPTASRVYLERPIPEETEEALEKWSIFWRP